MKSVPSGEEVLSLLVSSENVAPLGWVTLNEMWESIPSGEEVLEGVLSLLVSGQNMALEYLEKCPFW